MHLLHPKSLGTLPLHLQLRYVRRAEDALSVELNDGTSYGGMFPRNNKPSSAPIRNPKMIACHACMLTQNAAESVTDEGTMLSIWPSWNRNGEAATLHCYQSHNSDIVALCDQRGAHLSSRREPVDAGRDLWMEPIPLQFDGRRYLPPKVPKVRYLNIDL